MEKSGLGISPYLIVILSAGAMLVFSMSRIDQMLFRAEEKDKTWKAMGQGGYLCVPEEGRTSGVQ